MMLVRHLRSITRMPPVVNLCASALVVCAIAASFAVAAHAQTGKLTFGGGKAAFVPPPGFKTLTAAQVKQFAPTADPRAQVIGDPTRSSTIAYLLIDIKLTRAQMDMFRKYMTETFTNANPAIKWVVNKLDTVGGRDGIRMEFTDDRQMHHISLTGYVDDEHAVMITYNTPVKELATLEPALRASIDSLRITP
jgi:hypothetical protein